MKAVQGSNVNAYSIIKKVTEVPRVENHWKQRQGYFGH